MGSFRPARHAKRLNEPQFDGEPVKPRGMDADAGKLWDRIVPQLVKRGVVKQIDTALLVMTCEVWALYRAAMKAAIADPVSKDARCAVLGYASQFDKLASHCGLNPMDRAKLSVPPKSEDEDDIEGFARDRKRA